MSIKGIRIRYFAIALGLIALAVGIYGTFFQTRGFEKTTATIVSIKEIESADTDTTEREVTVEYTVDGTIYTEVLDFDSPSYKAGKAVTILYNPNDPSSIHGGQGFSIYLIVIGVVLLAVAIFSIMKGKQSLEKLKETQAAGKEATYPPPTMGEERELYFLTDLGTPKYGHRIEDAGKKVLFEAKMTKFTLTSPFGFDFIDHEHGRTTAHLVGHQESSEWGTLILDNHYTFTFDGEDIWKHIKRNGIRVDSSFGGGSGKFIGANYVIYRNDVELARVESTSQYVHEEDAQAHSKLGSAIPIKGFFRIWTRAQNLDLLFVTLLAFARTDASADTGGNYKTLFSTFKNR